MPDFDDTRTTEHIELKVSDADAAPSLVEGKGLEIQSSANEDAAAAANSASGTSPTSYREWRSSQRKQPEKKAKTKVSPKSILTLLGATLMFFAGASCLFVDFATLQQRWVMSTFGVETEAVCVAQQTAGNQLWLLYNFRDTRGEEHEAWRRKDAGDPTLAIGKAKTLRYVPQMPSNWRWKDSPAGNDTYQLIYTFMLGLSLTLGGLAIGAKKFVESNTETGLTYVSPKLSKLACTVGAGTMIFSGGTGVTVLGPRLLSAAGGTVATAGYGIAFAVLLAFLLGGLVWFHRTWFGREA